MAIIIIATTLIIYSIFWLWYVGFSRATSPALTAQVLAALNHGNSEMMTDTHRKTLSIF